MTISRASMKSQLVRGKKKFVKAKRKNIKEEIMAPLVQMNSNT